MANTCYMGVELSNLNDFSKVLSYMSDNEDRFEDVDYLGAAFVCDKYVLRFESRWKPVMAVGSRISRECAVKLKLWYQETGVSMAGWVEYQYGEKMHTHKIDCDIFNAEMRDCLYLTDWAGITWWQTFGEHGEYCFQVHGEPRNPDFFRVTLNKYNDALQEVTLRTVCAWGCELREVYEKMKQEVETK